MLMAFITGFFVHKQWWALAATAGLLSMGESMAEVSAFALNEQEAFMQRLKVTK